MTFSSLVGFFVLYFCATSVAQRIFKCDPVLPNVLSINGTKFECPKGKLCNRYAPDNFQEHPCVDKTKLCEDRYKCLNETTVKFEGINFNVTCTKGKVCNGKYLSPCNECICGGFTCLEKDNMVEIHNLGFNYTCPSGQVCNRQNVAPCLPCVNK